jgi:hypothetical protein
MRALLFILILFAAGICCHGRAALLDTNLVAGTFACEVASTAKIHLVISADGTYKASVEEFAGTRRESGTWIDKHGELIFQRRSGDAGFAIRRLRPDRENPGELLWIVPGAGNGGGAVQYPVFHRVKS